jgi:hypothetical protein
MRLHPLQYFTWFLLLTLIGGCEKDVKNVDLPPFEQKLVLASFISPSDSVSYVFVSSNRRIYGELGAKEQTGIISGTISDGSHEIELDTARYGLQVSRDKLKIEYGKPYTLNVISDKGLSATATCVVPGRREFNVTADTFSTPDPYIPTGYLQRRIDVRLSIMDIPGEENYYRIAGKGIGYITNQREGKQHTVTDIMRFEKEFFSDAGNDGKQIVIQTDYGLNYFYGHDSAFLEVYLFNTEKSYYLYHKSLENYSGDENPFRESSPVFSNVTGGLGIFASYTVDTLVFRLK